MPDLPTLTLSQAHFDRVVAAFPGATLGEKAAAYQRWLTNRLIDRVQTVERARLTTQFEAALEQARTQLEASLPPRPPDAQLP